MARLKLTIPALSRLQSAQSLAEARSSINNDTFFEFQVAYRACNSDAAETDESSPATGAYVATTLKLLEEALDHLNALLVLDPDLAVEDRARCDALRSLLLAGKPNESQRSPLHNLLLHLLQDVNARLYRPRDKPAHARLVSLA